MEKAGLKTRLRKITPSEVIKKKKIDLTSTTREKRTEKFNRYRKIVEESFDDENDKIVLDEPKQKSRLEQLKEWRSKRERMKETDKIKKSVFKVSKPPVQSVPAPVMKTTGIPKKTQNIAKINNNVKTTNQSEKQEKSNSNDSLRVTRSMVKKLLKSPTKINKAKISTERPQKSLLLSIPQKNTISSKSESKKKHILTNKNDIVRKSPRIKETTTSNTKSSTSDIDGKNNNSIHIGKKNIQNKENMSRILCFRENMESEKCNFVSLCNEWQDVMDKCVILNENIIGDIRTAIGQAELLMKERFKQFKGLIDNCEFKSGEKETTCQDLQGFWDMVLLQIDDINKKFSVLKEKKANNWEEEEKEIETISLIKKKKFVKNPLSTKNDTVTSKFAEFRKQKQKELQSNKNIVSSPSSNLSKLQISTNATSSTSTESNQSIFLTPFIKNSTRSIINGDLMSFSPTLSKSGKKSKC